MHSDRAGITCILHMFPIQYWANRTLCYYLHAKIHNFPKKWKYEKCHHRRTFFIYLFCYKNLNNTIVLSTLLLIHSLSGNRKWSVSILVEQEKIIRKNTYLSCSNYQFTSWESFRGTCKFLCSTADVNYTEKSSKTRKTKGFASKTR